VGSSSMAPHKTASTPRANEAPQAPQHNTALYLLLQRARRQQAVDEHLLLLALAPHARHRLQVVGRIPVCAHRSVRVFWRVGIQGWSFRVVIQGWSFRGGNSGVVIPVCAHRSVRVFWRVGIQGWKGDGHLSLRPCRHTHAIAYRSLAGS